MVSVYCLGIKKIKRIAKLYCYFRLKSMFRHVGVPSRATKYIGNSGYPLFSQSNPILYHIIRFTTKICFAGRLKCYHNPVDIREGCFLIYFLHLKVKLRTQDRHEPRKVYVTVSIGLPSSITKVNLTCFPVKAARQRDLGTSPGNKTNK